MDSASYAQYPRARFVGRITQTQRARKIAVLLH
jgi:hypothetical protein